MPSGRWRLSMSVAVIRVVLGAVAAVVVVEGIDATVDD
jgi:hypothetical protein